MLATVVATKNVIRNIFFGSALVRMNDPRIAYSSSATKKVVCPKNTRRSNCSIYSWIDAAISDHTNLGRSKAPRLRFLALEYACWKTCVTTVVCWRIPRVDELMKLFYPTRTRRRHQQGATTMINSTMVAGSGTVELGLSLALLLAD